MNGSQGAVGCGRSTPLTLEEEEETGGRAEERVNRGGVPLWPAALVLL